MITLPIKDRRSWIALFIILLVILNVWHWWPADTVRPVARNLSGGTNSYRPEDFVLNLHPGPGGQHLAGRDLFQPVIKAKPVAVARTPIIVPPPKSPEQLAEEAARAEFAQFRVMGILFRGGKGQAYVHQGADTFMVQAGEKIGSRFVVIAIENDAIEIKDPVTNVSGRIPVSGK